MLFDSGLIGWQPHCTAPGMQIYRDWPAGASKQTGGRLLRPIGMAKAMKNGNAASGCRAWAESSQSAYD
jgi:hypothetical protein